MRKPGTDIQSPCLVFSFYKVIYGRFLENSRFLSILRLTGIDQLSIAGQRDLFVGVIYHQVAASGPDGNIPALLAHAVGHRRHHGGADRVA